MLCLPRQLREPGPFAVPPQVTRSNGADPVAATSRQFTEPDLAAAIRALPLT
jgi:hypothetical protein